MLPCATITAATAPFSLPQFGAASSVTSILATAVLLREYNPPASNRVAERRSEQSLHRYA